MTIPGFINTAFSEIPPLPLSYTGDTGGYITAMSGYMRTLSAWSRHVSDYLNKLSQGGAGVVPVSQGGTGLSTFTANVIYKGAGTAPLVPSALIENGSQTTISYNAATPPAGNLTPTLQIIAANTTNNALELDAAAAVNVIEGFRCENTIASPSQTGAGVTLLRIAIQGYDSTPQRTANTATINFNTVNAYTNTDWGSNIDVKVIPVGAVTLSTAATFQAPGDGGQLLAGQTNASSVPAGKVGEYVSSVILVANEVNINAAANITSITLSAGNWDVWGEGWLDNGTGGATVSGATRFGINTTSATMPTTPADGTAVSSNSYVPNVSNSTAMRLPVGPCKINVSTSTTVYLVGACTVSAGTANGYGKLCAERRQ